MHWRRWFKRTRDFAVRPRGWQGGSERRASQRRRRSARKGALVRVGPENPGGQTIAQCRFPEISAAMLRNQKEGTVAARWCTHASGEHLHARRLQSRVGLELASNRDLATPNSLLRVINLLHILAALLHSPDGCIKGDSVARLPRAAR